MIPCPRAGVSADPVLAVGWIFADLLLGLLVVLLASQVIVPKRTEADPPEPSVKTLATMEKKPTNLVFTVDAAGLLANRPKAIKRLRRTVQGETSALRKKQRQAAMVLIWGWAPNTDTGQDIAGKVARQLTFGTGKLFAKSRNRQLWHGGRAGRVELELFLYEQERSPG